MKCPSCGHWNKPSFPHCFKCGEPLPQSTRRRPDWQDTFEKPRKESTQILYHDAAPQVVDLDDDLSTPIKPEAEPLASEMAKLKDRRERGAAYLEAFRKNASEQGIAPSGSGVTTFQRQAGFFTDVPDDPDETVYKPPEIRRKLRAGRGEAGSAVLDAYAIDDFEPLPEDLDAGLYEDDLPVSFDEEIPLPPVRRAQRHKKRRRNPVSLAIWTVRLLALVAVGFLAWQGVLYLQSASSQSGGDGEEATVYMEPTQIDGYPGQHVRISGTEGSKIYIRELMRSFVVVDGFASFDVADYEFYDNLARLEADSIEARMTPIVMEVGGAERRLKPITYMVDIPISPIRLLSPEVENITVSTSLYNMSFQVAQNSKVIVNGKSETDTVTSKGVATVSVPIEAIGENKVTITVRSPHCRENNMTLTFYRDPQEIPLQLAPDTSFRTSTRDMTINASTVAGAHISVESPTFWINDENLQSGKSGQFSFSARMERVGSNKITLRASMPGKMDSVLEHTVTYLPSEAEYTTKAWALTAADYAQLLANIKQRTENAQIYLCHGEIIEIMSNNPQIVIMNTSRDGGEQLVMLQNETSKTWELGQTYKVFADVNGMYDVMPKLIARYSIIPDAATK